MYELPIYIWILVGIGVIGIPATTSFALYRGALAAGSSRRTATWLAAAAGYVLVAWLVVSGLLAGAGIFHADSGESTAWSFGLAFAGALGGMLLATRIPIVRRSLAAPGMLPLLTLPHTLRVVGVAFVLVMALGDLPWIFALPAGLGDIAIGLSAPFVARALARDEGLERAVRFNVLGIVDLVVALTIGFLTGLGPFGFDVTPSTEPLALLPLALVPTVAVPTALALHIVSLVRLREALRDKRMVQRILSERSSVDITS
jgi:hypothetical protein